MILLYYQCCLQVLITDDTGASANATYVGTSPVGENAPSCQWVLYSTTDFVAPRLIREDQNLTVAAEVARQVQGPIASLPVPRQTPSQNSPVGINAGL